MAAFKLFLFVFFLALVLRVEAELVATYSKPISQHEGIMFELSDLKVPIANPKASRCADMGMRMVFISATSSDIFPRYIPYASGCWYYLNDFIYINAELVDVNKQMTFVYSIDAFKKIKKTVVWNDYAKYETTSFLNEKARVSGKGYKYGDVVKLKGVLVKEVGEKPDGDIVNYSAIKLVDAIDVTSTDGDEFEPMEIDVDLIHLFLGDDLDGAHKALYDKNIFVDGELFHAVNGHHQTPVLMMVSKIYEDI